MTLNDIYYVNPLMRFSFFITYRLAEGNILSRNVRINEYMDIFCPQFDTDTPEKDLLQFVIYNVSEEAFMSCQPSEGTVV